jgi:hypothetical protein
MKKQVHAILLLTILVGMLSISAQAQIGGTTRLIAHIPFDFAVGDRILPAGEYTMTCTNPTSDHKVLQFRSRDGKAVAMVQTASVIGNDREGARLLFHRYGDRYFFAKAWLPADQTGMQAVQSKAERAAARQLAGTKPKIETVVLNRPR